MEWNVCKGCEAILRVVSQNTAKKYNIPFVMWGASRIEARDPTKFEQINRGDNQNFGLKSSLKKLLKRLKIFLKNPHKGWLLSIYDFYSVVQRVALGFPIKYALNPLSVPPLSNNRPKFILFFDFIDWDSLKNSNLLENEISWKHPKGIISRFDCSLHCVSNSIQLKNYGISADGFSFCKFVRNGTMNREKAADYEENVVNSVKVDYEKLLTKLELE